MSAAFSAIMMVGELVLPDVIANQQSRMAIDRALRTGAHTAWDFQPVQDASKRYMRNNLDLNALEHTARFPRPD